MAYQGWLTFTTYTVTICSKRLSSECSNIVTVTKSNSSDKCPTHGKKCLKCNKLNHFKAMCRSQVTAVKSVQQHKKSSDYGCVPVSDRDRQPQSKEVDCKEPSKWINVNTSTVLLTPCIQSFAVAASCNTTESRHNLLQCAINGKGCHGFLDRGATVSVISEHIHTQKLKDITYP